MSKPDKNKLTINILTKREKAIIAKMDTNSIINSFLYSFVTSLFCYSILMNDMFTLVFSLGIGGLFLITAVLLNSEKIKEFEEEK